MARTINDKPRMPLFARSLLLLTFVLLLTACSERADQPVQVAPSQDASRAAPEAVIPKTTQTAQQILASFKNDLKACKAVVRYRIEPPTKYEVDSKKPESILNIAPYAGTPEAAYIKANSDYVAIGISYHPDPFSVASFKELEPVYCAVYTQRLTEIETLGASEEGWEIREYFLTIGIDHLESALDSGPGSDSIRWDWLQGELGQAERLYAKNHREKVLAISQRAADTIEASRAEADKYWREMNKAERETPSALMHKSETDKALKERADFIKGLIGRL